jgi:NAD(P)-dependent dehydrogenase (short-subunit alcohol dehydrogenase family)
VKGKDFCGQVVVVTGAASGIGRETARAFAGRGAELALADIDRAGLLDVEADLRRDGRRVLARAVDVSRAEEMERFANEVYGLLGRTDVLVNNAGIAINGFVEDMELTDWRRIVDVNVWGVIHGCHFFYPRMATSSTSARWPRSAPSPPPPPTARPRARCWASPRRCASRRRATAWG